MASKTPTRNEEITTTTTENFAVLGWAAPSSFDTLTLHSKINSEFSLLSKFKIFNMGLVSTTLPNRKVGFFENLFVNKPDSCVEPNCYHNCPSKNVCAAKILGMIWLGDHQKRVPFYNIDITGNTIIILRRQHELNFRRFGDCLFLRLGLLLNCLK